jgi:hypothetical protein
VNTATYNTVIPEKVIKIKRPSSAEAKKKKMDILGQQNQRKSADVPVKAFAQSPKVNIPLLPEEANEG